MKAAVFKGTREITIEDRPIPEIGENDVLVRVAYCGICGSDVQAYKMGNYPEDIVIGHEIVGYIEKVGRNVDNLEEGACVVVNALIPCGECFYCRQGRSNLCNSLDQVGITRDGGLAEYISVPSRAIHELADDKDLYKYTLVDPLSNVLHAIYLSSFKPLNITLVQGAGPIGLLTINVLKNFGARKILVSEISPMRLELAKRIGASHLINPLEENIFEVIDSETDGEGVDIIFDCTGAPEAIQANATLVRKGGEIIVIGICEVPVNFDFFTLVYHEITIKGSYAQRIIEYDDAIKMIQKHNIRYRDVITKIVSLDSVIDAFKILASKKPIEGKIVVNIF